MLKARNATALIPTSRTTSATGSYSSQCLLCTLMLHLAEKNPATDATRDGVLVLGPLILGARGTAMTTPPAASRSLCRKDSRSLCRKEKHHQPGGYLPDGCATPERAG